MGKGLPKEDKARVLFHELGHKKVTGLSIKGYPHQATKVFSKELKEGGIYKQYKKIQRYIKVRTK